MIRVMQTEPSNTPPTLSFTRYDLPGSGVSLSCREAGSYGRPLLLFLHGFPEAAWVWDATLQHFAQPEHGGFHCVAPNLRGYEDSSHPTSIEAYRAKHLVGDLVELIDAIVSAKPAREGKQPGAFAVVAHDWGGAIAWGLAALHPQRTGRLVILNAPHPATFHRELSQNPLQQSASAYMHFLARPDAAGRLAENDYARLWPFFESMGASAGGRAWLTPALREAYRNTWNQGLGGPCAYYAASPLRPPTDGAPSAPPPAHLCHVTVPTQVIWGMADHALRPELLDGLENWVPNLHTTRLPDASHWLLHECPETIWRIIEKFLISEQKTDIR